MSDKAFWIGILFGAAVGAGIGLLIAPQQGVSTRKHVIDATRTARNRVGEVAGSVKQRVSNARWPIRQAI